jgi:hypothetical protein
VVKAKAFKQGYASSSAVSTVSYTNSLKTTVQFVSTDTTTQGNWPATYGQDAYWIMSGDSKPSPAIDWSTSAHDSYIWSDNAPDTRALRRSPVDTVRLAACWSATDQFVFNMIVYAANPHPLVLYFMDWDRNGRVEEVTISDMDGLVLDQKTVDHFAEGKYFVWNVKGSVRIAIKRVQGNNAIINGLFIGPEIVPPVSSAPPALSNATAGSSLYRMQILGEPGQTFTVESSDDLLHWIAVETQTLTNNMWNFVDKFSTTQNTRLYRARLIP